MTPFYTVFPERFVALAVTLLVEIPVFLMIFGGSDELTEAIGLRRYQLLMSFLPLSSAISGNCGKYTDGHLKSNHVHITFATN